MESASSVRRTRGPVAPSRFGRTMRFTKGADSPSRLKISGFRRLGMDKFGNVVQDGPVAEPTSGVTQ